MMPHTGFKDGGCCCNCIHLVELNSHPWNKKIGKGPCSKIMGYACSIMAVLRNHDENEGETRDDSIRDRYTFSENPHGYCEMYSPTKIGLVITRKYWRNIESKERYNL